MNDLGVHLLLFLAVSVAIVVLSAFFSHAEDGPAMRAVPRRLVSFVVGCAILAAILLALEHTVASVS